MTGACSIPTPRCGYAGPGVAGHHILGRAGDGAYVQPELLLPLCQPDCHQSGAHALLRAAGIDGPREATPGLLVGRVGVTLLWTGWTRQGDVTLSAQLLAEVGDALGVLGRQLRQPLDCPGCGTSLRLDAVCRLGPYEEGRP